MSKKTCLCKLVLYYTLCQTFVYRISFKAGEWEIVSLVLLRRVVESGRIRLLLVYSTVNIGNIPALQTFQFPSDHALRLSNIMLPCIASWSTCSGSQRYLLRIQERFMKVFPCEGDFQDQNFFVFGCIDWLIP